MARGGRGAKEGGGCRGGRVCNAPRAGGGPRAGRGQWLVGRARRGNAIGDGVLREMVFQGGGKKQHEGGGSGCRGGRDGNAPCAGGGP